MAQDQARQFLMQGINAAQAGQKDQARQLLQNAIRLEPQNETAWLWMTSLARDQRERLFCLQNLLQINPQNEMGLKLARQLNIDPAQFAQPQTAQAAPGVSSTVPALSQDRLGPMLSAVDEFVRAYRPAPVAPGTEWVTKESGLYGQAAALRRQMRRYGALGAVGLVLLFGLLFGIVSLVGGLGDDSTAINPRLFTSTPSPTATNTATATPGVTTTPSVEPAVTDVPSQAEDELVSGSVFGNTPTPIQPTLATGLGRTFQQAVNLYSIGEYEEAILVFEDERRRAEQTNISCAAEAYYFNALALAEMGGRNNFDDAEAMLEQAQNRTTCQTETNEHLLYAGGCVVNYLRWLELGDDADFTESAQYCDLSLAINLRTIVLAATTRARLYMVNGNNDAAAQVLDDALEQWPSDINLLLVRARVEIARQRFANALYFINRALYVDPLSEQALRLRVEAYLDIAEAEVAANPERAKQIYGTAVIYTQEYLLYYAGRPEGYLLMAQARMGEGNTPLAEESLNTVIENEDNLPELSQPVVREAYAMRVRLYEQSARYQEAFADVETLLRDDLNNPQLLEQRLNLALRLNDYALVYRIENGQPSGDLVTLLAQQPDNTRLRLLQVRFQTEYCLSLAQLDCDYVAALNTLSDDFVNDLEGQAALDALTYRAIARYHVTLERGDNLSNNERTRELNDALSDLNEVQEASETGLNMYYRGLILVALGEPEEALSAFSWVSYWSQFYDYPFIGEVQVQRGLIFEAQGNIPEAVKAFESALEWAEIYDYNYVEDVEERLETLREQLPDEDTDAEENAEDEDS